MGNNKTYNHKITNIIRQCIKQEMQKFSFAATKDDCKIILEEIRSLKELIESYRKEDEEFEKVEYLAK